MKAWPAMKPERVELIPDKVKLSHRLPTIATSVRVPFYGDGTQYGVWNDNDLALEVGCDQRFIRPAGTVWNIA